jgi:ABC-type glutathione transport system ATPase component
MTIQTVPHATAEPLLRAAHLRKSYGRNSFWSDRVAKVAAVDDVSFSLARSSCAALVGQSGSGKSTLAACLARLEDLDEGEVWFEDVNFTQLHGKELRTMRPRVQLIFQDATAALNPRLSATELVEEPLVIQEIGNTGERRERARETLVKLGIAADRHDCRAQEFSGGQRKRIALARGLMLDPRLLILDEVFSGLDLLVANEILTQLLELRIERELTLLFVSHDLNFVARAVDSIMVMHHGKIVEQGNAQELFRKARHPYAQSLFAAHRELQDPRAKGAAQ